VFVVPYALDLKQIRENFIPNLTIPLLRKNSGIGDSHSAEASEVSHAG
jgi:hypothetical protein